MDTNFIVERTHYYSPAINIVMVVTIGGAPSVEELQNAIKKAIRKHEIFGHKVILDEKGDSYYSPIPKSILKIETMKSNHEEDWKQIIHEQERIPFDFVHGELIRFFILQKMDVMQLIIVAHHLSGDGLAITYLIRDIMTALGNPLISFEKQPIQVFKEEMLPKEATLKLWLRLLLKQSNNHWRRSGKVFQYEDYLAMFDAFWKNRQTAVENEVISGIKMNNLLATCKENHVTVNSTLITAFYMSVKTEKEVGIAVNVRPEGYEGMGNYASGISIRYKPNYNMSFWDNTRKVQELIYKKIKNRKYFILKFLSSIDPTLVDATYFSAFDGYDNSMARRFRDIFGYSRNQKGISMTNLTKLKIPSVYDKYTIDTIDFVAPLVPYGKRLIGVVTLEDKMSITMQYEVKEGSEDRKAEFERAINLLYSNL